MRRTGVLGSLLVLALVVAPRVYLWGTAPVGVHGDEGGFSALGADYYANPLPIWTFGPNSMPNAHLWLIGYARHLYEGDGIWPGRLVTSLFGLLQALAVVSMARRLVGLAGSVTAALVMAIPLEIQFERVVFANVWTTATWTCALWLVMRAPRSLAMAFLAGVVLALGFYGYQSSRIAPLIAAVGIAAALYTAGWRACRFPILSGLLGFAIAVAPIAYGFVLTPRAFTGRAESTSWVQSGVWNGEAWWRHTEATIGAVFAGSGDWGVLVIPLGVGALALLGVLAAPNRPLAWCLGAWIALVMAGHVVRDVLFYPYVLVCMIPALALAAACSVRWLGAFIPPLVLVATLINPLPQYFRDAVVMPPTEAVPMMQSAFLRQLNGNVPIYVAGGPGCEHGMTLLALRGRACRNVDQLPTDTNRAVVIVYPEFQTLARDCHAAQLQSRSTQWGDAPVQVCFSSDVARNVADALPIH